MPLNKETKPNLELNDYKNDFKKMCLFLAEVLFVIHFDSSS